MNAVFLRPATLAALCLPLCLAPLPALAHAVLIGSTPASGATVAPGQTAIALHYNSRIDHGRSSVMLTRPDQSRERLKIEDGGATDTLTLKTALEAAGSYNIRWQVLAVDGHITRGDVPFTVGTVPAAAAPQTP